ncbi:hypothetical protein ACFQJC_03835 [Haloferax namakaokahaiae]|uniref:DUF7982 domain-containing protein n=1 Tax=Haloferax namakaokahaiae TaxID=1748331 RepID=A0ABD5ZBT5_9EURY
MSIDGFDERADDHRADGHRANDHRADSHRTDVAADEHLDSDASDDVAALRRENARLRQRYADVRKNQYRQTSLALFALGVVGVVSAALVPPVRETLLVLGAIGLFAAAVTRYVSPEQFIPVGVGSSVYRTQARNADAIADELGLQDARVYVPDDDDRATVRLFVPERRSYTVPEPDALRETFVITDDETERGVAFAPSGAGLFDEFEESRDGPLGDDPATLARQATDALVELFELVETADAETDREHGRLTVRVGSCRFGSAATFDTPVASFVAVTVARGLDVPVTAEVTSSDDTDFVVTCRWDPADTTNATVGET